jgi:hypothetical protein
VGRDLFADLVTEPGSREDAASAEVTQGVVELIQRGAEGGPHGGHHVSL